MSNRWIPLTLGAATAIPFGLLGGFGPTGDHSILPWLGMVAGWGAWMLKRAKRYHRVASALLAGHDRTRTVLLSKAAS